MRKINYQLIKINFIYTIIELAKLLSVHPDTVRVWIRKGLQKVKGARNPILIKGAAAKTFLKKRKKSRKCNLQETQFYCLKCRAGRTAIPDSINIEILDDELTPENRKAIINGKCAVCEHKVIRFSSEEKVQIWLKSNWVDTENVKLRYSDSNPALNTHVSNDEKTSNRRIK